MKVRLRIDSILLDGVAAAPHPESVLREALAAELRSAFGRQEEFAPSTSSRRSVVVPAFSASTPESLGSEIGRAIHGSLQRHGQ